MRKTKLLPRKKKKFTNICELLSKSGGKLPKRGILELGPGNNTVTLFVSKVKRKRRIKEKKIVSEIKKFTYFKTKDINGLDLELSNFCKVDTRV